jgi:hypothetical protein
MTEEKSVTPETQSQGPNPALKDLEVLIGDWDLELSNASFLPDPSATFRGRVSIAWLEAGGFMVMHQGTRPTAPFATWVIGRDDASETYQVFYFDDRRVSRIYAMSFANRVWKLWREAPGFSQRFTATLSPDGDRITSAWEKSSDGQHWEHDFDLAYTRITQDLSGPE